MIKTEKESRYTTVVECEGDQDSNFAKKGEQGQNYNTTGRAFGRLGFKPQHLHVLQNIVWREFLRAETEVVQNHSWVWPLNKQTNKERKAKSQSY